VDLTKILNKGFNSALINQVASTNMLEKIKSSKGLRKLKKLGPIPEESQGMSGSNINDNSPSQVRM